MPNHITTYLSGPKEVLDSLKGSQGDVDFNSVIPFPEVLEKITAEVAVVDTQEEADKINAENNARDAAMPENIRKLMGLDGPRIHAITSEQYDILMREHGALNWYGWNTSHWGTKWNAYDINREGDTEVFFDTAWAHPLPVIVALAEKFPEATLTVKYADEDLGSNLGHYTIKGGADGIVEELQTPQDAISMAIRLKYGQSVEEFLEENQDDPEYLEYFEKRFGLSLPSDPKAIEA